jgi:peptidyl-prolyl cis-trans isomerase C
MKKLFIGIVVVLCFFSCTKKENGKVLVTIDKEKITVEEFNKELDKIPMNMKMAVATESGKKSFLDRLIMKKLLLIEANKEKMENEKEFQTRLLDIKEQLLIESLLKKKIASNAQLNDEELKKYYDANKDKFKKEKEINTRHILLKTEEEAKQIKEKLQNGEDFVELAKKYSIDPNAKTTGGELGFYPKGSLLPEYEDIAFKLAKVGQVSGVVKSQYGYHIIRLEGTKPPAFVAFDEVKDFIKQQLAQEKQKELIEKYIEDLKKSAKLTINENLLKEEKPAAPEKPEAQDKTGKETPGDASKEQKETDAPATQKK